MKTTEAFKGEEGRSWLRELLATNTKVVVDFNKVDGTRRTMTCTLAENVVVPYEKKTDRTREPNAEVLRVWDVEKNEWRGFRYDSINYVQFDLANEVK